jgi:DtxR family Mn-dependent transcriptional regulator
MIGRLERDGYIERAADKTIGFTESGQEHAEGIVRRHRLIERFLTDVLGIPWDEVHEEAERLEHAMSPVLEERMLAAIGDAKTCPHGHPITPGARIEGVPLADVEMGAKVTVLRFENEAEDLLHELKAAGLEPGLEGTLAEHGDDVVVESQGRRVSVTASVAETVSVIADPSPPQRIALPEQLVSPRTATGASRRRRPRRSSSSCGSCPPGPRGGRGSRRPPARARATVAGGLGRGAGHGRVLVAAIVVHAGSCPRRRAVHARPPRHGLLPTRAARGRARARSGPAHLTCSVHGTSLLPALRAPRQSAVAPGSLTTLSMRSLPRARPA